MKDFAKQLFKARRLWLTALLALACFAVSFLVWIVGVRPNTGKSLSVKLCDHYEQTSAPIEDSLTQTYTLESDQLALAFVFGISGEQPVGALELTISDAATGEVLAESQGDMANILPGQYTGMGLDRLISADTQRAYRLTLTPHYEGAGRLQIGYSDGVQLEGQTLTVDGSVLDGTMALLVTSEQIGRFLSLYYWAVALLAILVLCGAFWAAGRKNLRLHRLCFALVMAFGVTFTMVLPPYSAPDEQYHINESFTLACLIANRVSGDEWVMTRIPTNYSYRRIGDTDPTIQDAETTVFTWRHMVQQLTSTTDEPMNSHWEYSDPQADHNPQMYLISALGVFLGYLLHLGFVPTLLLGRLFNLTAFALAVSYSVYKTPIGKQVFLVCSLLPMTLHLGASFSRDSLLLGLCFLFTALCLHAAYGPDEKLRVRQLILPALLGLLITPCKAVYFPLIFLIFLIPSARLGKRALLLRLGYLGCCGMLFLAFNLNIFAGFFGMDLPSEKEAELLAQQTLLQQEQTEQTAAAISAAASAASAEPSASPAASAAATETKNPAASGAAQEESAGNTASSETAALSDAASLLEGNSAARGATGTGLVLRVFAVVTGQVPSAEEVTFWVTSLERVYTDLCTFLQYFFLSSSYDIENKSDAELLRDLTYVMHDRAPTEEEVRYWLNYFAEQPSPVYKLYVYFLEYRNLRNYIDEGLGYYPGDVDRERTSAEYTDLRGLMETKFAEDAALNALPEEDTVCYDLSYILHHPVDTVLLVFNSVLEYGDHYIRTLVGGSLSYYSLDLAWGWVLLLYLVLGLACVTVPQSLQLQGRARLLSALLVVLCCGLSVLGCVSWTPTYYTAIYGLQGRYFLPVVPLALLVLRTRRITANRDLSAGLTVSVCAINVGVLLNAMLAVIAR